MTKKVVSVQLNKMYLDSLFVFRDINYISTFFKKKKKKTCQQLAMQVAQTWVVKDVIKLNLWSFC